MGEFCLPLQDVEIQANLTGKIKMEDENRYEHRVDLCNCLKMSVRQFKDPRGLFSQTLDLGGWVI